MADNTTLNTGTGGDVIASDDISGVKHQRVKIQHGGDGAATDVSTASPLPCEPRENDGTSLVNAHDAVAGDSGQLGMLKAASTTPTSVADADAVLPMADLKGRGVVVRAPRELIVQASLALTAGTTETTLLAAGAAGVFHDLTHILINNNGNARLLTLRDSTAGGTILSMNLGNGAESGWRYIQFDPPLKQTTAANNWTAEINGASTTFFIHVQAIATSA